METQNVVIATYLCLLIVALMMGEPITAVFVFFSGSLVLAMYQYGGDRLRKVLRRLLLTEYN